LTFIKAYCDRLEVGEPITLESPDNAKLDGHITAVSRGKKGAQVAIKHGKRTSTWHLPTAAFRARPKQEAVS
jgi:hypothetical protein